MWLVACIIAACIVMALIPFVLAGILLALSALVTGGVSLLAWLLSPLESLINGYNRFTHRIGYRVGRALRAIINRVKGR